MNDHSAAAAMSFERVSVEFGTTRALDEFSLNLRPGEIVGLLGHNGAGKSTVVNVATGALAPTGGRMFLAGEELPTRSSPGYLARRGISVIHQEPALSPNLSIEQNLFLGQESVVPAPRRRTVAQQALDRVGVTASLNFPLSTLSLGHRQLVNLARSTVAGELQVLFLDEPTAALGREDTEKLHQTIKNFAASGTAVAYVSHRLSDVLDVCDRIVVLREGRLVLDRPTSDVRLADLTSALAPGIRLSEFQHGEPGASVLEFPGRGAQFRAGEVVGLFGMAGGDQFRLLENAFGVRRDEKFEYFGKRCTFRGPAQAIHNGVHMVPADRERDGVLSGTSADMNLHLPWLHRFVRGWGPIAGKARQRGYEEARKGLRILGPAGTAPLQAFSGGNRQKHVVGRWIYPRRPKLLLLAQPSQGVDIGAKQDIIREIRRLADEGVCTVVASAEADEVVSMCDRAYVVDRGRCIDVSRSETFEDDLVDTLIEIVELERER